MIAKDNIERAQRGLIATWQLWMQFFTWFFGGQILLLWARPELLSDARIGRTMAFAWIGNNLAGLAIGLCVGFYTLRTGRRVGSQIEFPVWPATFGAWLNALALAGNCYLWWIIATRKDHA